MFSDAPPSAAQLQKMEQEGFKTIDDLQEWAAQAQMKGRLEVNDAADDLGELQHRFGNNGLEFGGTLGTRSQKARGRGSLIKIHKDLGSVNHPDIDKIVRIIFLHEVSHAKSADAFGGTSTELGVARFLEELGAHMHGLRAEYALFGMNPKYKSSLRRAFEARGERGVVEDMLRQKVYQRSFGVKTVEELEDRMKWNFDRR